MQMLKNLVNRIKSELPEREEGQGTIEYILVLGVIVVGIFSLLVWTPLGTALSNAIVDVTNLFTNGVF